MHVHGHGHIPQRINILGVRRPERRSSRPDTCRFLWARFHQNRAAPRQQGPAGESCTGTCGHSRHSAFLQDGSNGSPQGARVIKSLEAGTVQSRALRRIPPTGRLCVFVLIVVSAHCCSSGGESETGSGECCFSPPVAAAITAAVEKAFTPLAQRRSLVKRDAACRAGWLTCTLRKNGRPGATGRVDGCRRRPRVMSERGRHQLADCCSRHLSEHFCNHVRRLRDTELIGG